MYREWKPYVPVAKRRAKAAAYSAKLAKREGRALSPIQISGRAIVQSFWGQAWCDHLELFSDFANRLPRGRTYVRNGSVVDLQIEPGAVKAVVSGSEIYQVHVKIKTLAPALWKNLKQDCARSIASLIDLLQGRLDEGVMKRLTERERGLFPQPADIQMKCSCPDWATMCKHVAAVLYGIGARLDKAPELLFALRNVDHSELVAQAVSSDNLAGALTGDAPGALQGSDLGKIFGIELETGAKKARPPRSAPKSSARRKKPTPKRRTRISAPQTPAVPAPKGKAKQPAPAAARQLPAKTTVASKKARPKSRRKPSA